MQTTLNPGVLTPAQKHTLLAASLTRGLREQAPNFLSVRCPPSLCYNTIPSTAEQLVGLSLSLHLFVWDLSRSCPEGHWSRICGGFDLGSWDDGGCYSARVTTLF